MEIVKKRVAELLNQQFNYESSIAPEGNRVMVRVPDADYEKRLGCLLREIQGLVDRHCPERKDHLYIIVHDRDRSRENTFKIWKPV